MAVIYGIWVSGQGWLRGTNNEALAFEDTAPAQSAADLWNLPGDGNRAVVLPFDSSLVDIQQKLLAREALCGTSTAPSADGGSTSSSAITSGWSWKRMVAFLGQRLRQLRSVHLTDSPS